MLEDNRNIDHWLKSRVNEYIKRATEHFELLETRDSIQNGFFNIMNDIRWYLRRTSTNSKVLLFAVETIIKLMCPIIPHIMEELWEKLGHEEFLSLEEWPKYNEGLIDKKVELEEKFIRSVLTDLREITERILKVKNPKSITLFVSPNWKYKIFKEAVKDKKDIKKRIMQDTEIRKHGKEAINIAIKLERSSEEICSFDGPENEFKILNNAQEFLRNESNAKSLEILYAENSKNKKAKYAEPMKPGIYIEAD
jgi:leucyl-tRNA synthetase